MPKGIDISRWQAVQDWGKVRQSVEFCYIKASQAGFTDLAFANHWKGGAAMDLPLGAYHFVDPLVSAVTQINCFIGQIHAPMRDTANTLKPVIDLEWMPVGSAEKWKMVKPAVGLKLISDICDGIAQHFGEPPVWYSSYAFLQYIGANPLNGFALWCADYRHDCPVPPPGFPSWVCWQTGQGIVPGIVGPVDMDVTAKDDLSDLLMPQRSNS